MGGLPGLEVLARQAPSFRAGTAPTQYCSIVVLRRWGVELKGGHDIQDGPVQYLMNSMSSIQCAAERVYGYDYRF